MRLQEIDIDRNFNKWNEIILNSPDFYTIAHNPSLIIFFKETFAWDGASYFIIENNEIVGVYQHVFPSNDKSVSMPHFSYGGLIRKDSQLTKKEIFRKILENLGSTFEIRDFEPYTSYYDASKVMAFLPTESTIDAQFEKLKSKRRWEIKKAYKNNLKVKIESSQKAILKFYEIYTKNMLRLGSPVLSKVFFTNLLNHYDYGDVKVFLVYKGREVIGGSVALTYNDFVEDCWLSTLSKYNHLYTSMLLYWEMIKYTIEQKKRFFSFGRSTKGSSILAFKRHWKPIEKKLYFSHSNPQKIRLKKMTFLTKIWKLLPLKIANFVGPKIADKLY